MDFGGQNKGLEAMYELVGNSDISRGKLYETRDRGKLIPLAVSAAC